MGAGGDGGRGGPRVDGMAARRLDAAANRRRPYVTTALPAVRPAGPRARPGQETVGASTGPPARGLDTLFGAPAAPRVARSAARPSSPAVAKRSAGSFASARATTSSSTGASSG